MLLAEKPNDWHSITAVALNMSRGNVKSVNYGILYGAQVMKIMKMVNCSKEKTTEIYNGFWESSPALKELKECYRKEWESTGKRYIIRLDGSRIFIRSKHSLLNFLFQSAGAIAAKYTTVRIYQTLEEQGISTDPFLGNPNVCSMIEIHDEIQFKSIAKLAKFKTFKTEEEGKEFIKNWEGVGQLGELTCSLKNIWFVTLPNVLSLAIEKAVEDTTKRFGLNVALGI